MLLVDGIIFLISLAAVLTVSYYSIRRYADGQARAVVEAAQIKEDALNERKQMQIRADEQMAITRGQIETNTMRVENEILNSIPKEKSPVNQIIEMVMQNPQILTDLVNSEALQKVLPKLADAVPLEQS